VVAGPQVDCCISLNVRTIEASLSDRQTSQALSSGSPRVVCCVQSTQTAVGDKRIQIRFQYPLSNFSFLSIPDFVSFFFPLFLQFLLPFLLPYLLQTYLIILSFNTLYLLTSLEASLLFILSVSLSSFHTPYRLVLS
jgi:hypothetical protein